jgi:cytochrome c oxidase subunit 3
MHSYETLVSIDLATLITVDNNTFIVLSILIFIKSIYSWFRDIIIEATFLGEHTMAVIQGLRYGMILFIVSEIMFFFSFFWAFFHSSVNPSIWIGGIWPPIGIHPLDPWKLPFLNTLILLSSGVTVTWAHRAMIGRSNKVISTSTNKLEVVNTLTDRQSVILALFMTIVYGCLFTLLQRYEYTQTDFTIADGIYGSTFFVTTGFHGLHVIIGTLFLIVCLVRHYAYHFTREYHFGLEAAIWYWHFVDVIWIILFITIYWWGSNCGL